MVMMLDRAFFERVEKTKREKLKHDLQNALLKSDFFEGVNDVKRQEFKNYFDKIWSDASSGFEFNYPFNLQKYVLIILTQSKWTKNPLHYQYAKIMIGLPNRPWRIESGIRAVYHNIIRQHYLGDRLVSFIDKREEP